MQDNRFPAAPPPGAPPASARRGWRRQRWGRWFFGAAPALLTGLLLGISGPGACLSRWPALLAWVAFVPLLAAIDTLPPSRAALAAFLAGAVAHAGWQLWMPGLFARFGGLSPALAIMAAVALVTYQALAWGAWGWLVRAHARGTARVLVAAAGFVVLERWYPAVFPWSLGLAGYRHPAVAQVAELGGPHVLSFLQILVSAVLASSAVASYRARRLVAWRTPALTGLLLAVAVAGGAMRIRQIDEARAAAPSLRAAAIQAGHTVVAWQTAGAPALLSRYRSATAAAERSHGPVDLVIWPEKASPMLRADAAHDYPPGHARRLREGSGAPLLFGADAVELSTRRLWNAAALLDASGRLRVVYEKHRLIVFSEWLPSWAARFVRGVRYQRGDRIEPIAVQVAGRAAPVAVGAFICFESAFPAHVRSLAAGGAELLVNLSDDSWFGLGTEPEQHLAHAVFRAIETRRDLVRAAGSGVTAHIAASGRIEGRLPISLPGAAPRAMVADARLLRVRSAHAVLGDAFALGCALLVVVVVAASIRAARPFGRGIHREQ